ncbi:MAG: hypothetical protein QXT28_06970 [Thermofilaceae archaeon]
MAKRGRKSDYKRLLALWAKNPTEPLPFTYIQAEAQKMGYAKRTVINYLNQLVAENFLEKTVDLKRQTFYKPRETILVRKEALKQAIEALNDEHVIESVEKLLMKKSNEKQRGGE